MGDQYGITNPRAFGAAGDGVSNDTSAIQSALDAGGNVYLPQGTYKIRSTLRVPSGARVSGAGARSVIRAEGVAGPAILLDDAYGDGSAAVEHLTVAGTATSAVEVHQMTRVRVCDVGLAEGSAFTDGFVFSHTYGSLFESLRTNGAAISDKCFSIGSVFNANTANSWYTSNAGSPYNFYIHGDQTLQPSGNTFNALAAQGGTVGLFLGWSMSNVFNAFYSENVVKPIVLGEYNYGAIPRGVVFNCGQISGAPGSPPGRITLVDIRLADGVEFRACRFIGKWGEAAPVSFVGGGGTGAQAVGLVAPDGTLKAITVISGGSGYTEPPAVVIRGAGVSAAAVALLAGGAVSAVEVSGPGASYSTEDILPIRYGQSFAGKILFSGCDIDAYPLQLGQPDEVWSAALWPWVTRASETWANHGVTIANDVATVEKLGSNDHRHLVSWRGADGSLASRIHAPVVYP